MHKPIQQVINNFSEKYALYGDMLFRICMVYLGRRVDAEEAMQESFFRLLYKSPQFVDEEHEKAWLIRVTTNICKDMLKSLWSKRVVVMEDVESYYEDPSNIHIMDEILSLPAKCKDVIYLHYYEDYDVRKISKTLGISESAVKMRLKRGREILKIQLEGDSYE